jgi:hypothetical protein
MTAIGKTKLGRSSIDPAMVKLSPVPIPRALRKKHLKAFLALRDLIKECRQNGGDVGSAVPIALSAVAHAICEVVHPQSDQEVLGAFASEMALIRGATDISTMAPAGTA